MKTQTTRLRDGDTLVTVMVKTESAVIQFADILEAVQVKPDELSEPPWVNADGLEHEVIDDNTEGQAAGSFRDDRGKMKRVITDQFKEWGSAGSGASKGVRFEAHAAEVARTIRYIAKCREDGWSVWGVTCDFMGKHDSCWGFYDDDSDSKYMQDAKREIAGEVAAQLEQDGFTIEGKPDNGKRRKYGWTLEEWREHFRANIHRDDWKGK